MKYLKRFESMVPTYMLPDMDDFNSILNIARDEDMDVTEPRFYGIDRATKNEMWTFIVKDYMIDNPNRRKIANEIKDRLEMIYHTVLLRIEGYYGTGPERNHERIIYRIILHGDTSNTDGTPAVK